MIDLEFEVVIVGFGPQLDFFDLNLCRVFAGFFGFLFLLVLELAVVHQLTNGRVCSFSNFNEVKALFFSHLECTQGRDDSDLLAISADKAYFFYTDASIDTGFFFFFFTDGLVSLRFGVRTLRAVVVLYGV